MQTHQNRYYQRIQELRASITLGYSDLSVQPIFLSEDELQQLESTLGSSLPADYREFLRNYGGYSLNAFFPLPDIKQAKRWGNIEAFFGLMPQEPRGQDSPYPLYPTAFDLLAIDSAFHDEKPAEFFCIATDTYNNVGIMLSGEYAGAVYFWDRDVAWDTSDYSGLFFVASSFDKFMHLLKTEEEFEIERSKQA